MVDLSANESASLIKLAARGAGYPWGLCEEAAAAGRWLSLHNLPAAQAFASLYRHIDGRSLGDFTPKILATSWVSSGVSLCPLLCGAALIDRANQFTGKCCIEIQNIITPILLIPFVSQLSTDVVTPMQLSWNDVVIGCCDGRIVANVELSVFIQHFTDNLNLATVTVASRYDPQTCLSKWPTNSTGRPEIPSQCIVHLKQFAQRTYAPNTELSRQLGAGAGNSDND